MTGTPPHLPWATACAARPASAPTPGLWLQRLSAWLLLILFFALPWLRIDGTPALLLDIATRQLHLFGLTLDARNAPSLIALGLAALSGLYLLTHLAGRLWCGYLCPQTVLGQLHTDWRKRLGPRLSGCLWLLTAVATGITFVGYFLPIHSLLLPPFDGWRSWSLFWAGFYALATWANITWLKSRVCTDLCPFARLQPWIGDEHTPHVHYQPQRGEPRGPRADDVADIATRGRRLLDPVTAQDYVIRSANPELAGPLPQFAPSRLGDCTDCGKCMELCPMGLDIRNGHDARCLDCGRCIDACNAQMRARHYRASLIRRRSASRMQGNPRRWLRPRTVIASMIFVLSLACAGWLA